MTRLYHAASVAAFGALFLFASPLPAQNASSTTGTKLEGADHRFVTEAAEGGMAEVEMGKLATEKASSSDVKQFGQRMVDDHTKANDELKSLASKNGWNLPAGIGAKNQAEKDRLSKLSGAEFDRAYMKRMVTDHKKDVGEFQKEANSAKDSDLKNFASKTLPTLQEHLRLAEDTERKVGGGAASGSADRSNESK
jgi:putative membrane protein